MAFMEHLTVVKTNLQFLELAYLTHFLYVEIGTYPAPDCNFRLHLRFMTMQHDIVMEDNLAGYVISVKDNLLTIQALPAHG
jgi:hypothetical protein